MEINRAVGTVCLVFFGSWTRGFVEILPEFWEKSSVGKMLALKGLDTSETEMDSLGVAVV